MNGQHYLSCPHDHYTGEVYENPLFDRYLSKYDVSYYYLDLEVSNMNTFLEGSATIISRATEDLDTVVFQFIDEMDVVYVELNSVEVKDFLHHEDAIYIPADIDAHELFKVIISYQGEAGQDRGFFAGITNAYDNTYEQWVTYTLSEPLNARDWFPVKQVLTDKADSVGVDLTVDKDLMAGSVGILESIDDTAPGKHTFRWRSGYPIAYYLISLAVADYMDYSFNAPLSKPGDSVLVQNFIYNDGDYLAEWKEEIEATGDMISLFSDLLLDYPFAMEKYGHAVAPIGGGMEHQTMTTLANFNFILVAHELAHQWFGNYVTCGNWQDIWINEGFASYFEYIALQNLAGQEHADRWMENAMALAMMENGSVYVPTGDADDPSRVFDYGLSYKKGAALLHMIRYELNNDTLFFGLLKDFLIEYAEGNATATEFREVLENISNRDFSCFFDQWYYGHGYPTFNLTWYRHNDTLYIQSLQETSSAETPLFKMTFDVRVKTDTQEPIYRLYQEKNEQLFAIPMNDFVWDVEFDPNKHLLARSKVEMRIPGSEDKGMAIGPNPFRENLIIKLKNSTGTEFFEVYNMDGKLVASGEIHSNPCQISLKTLGNGPYILIIEGEWGRYKEKIIKAGN